MEVYHPSAGATYASTSTPEDSYPFQKAAQAIKDAVSIEDYLSDMGVELKRGRTRCPLHNGDNPSSFSVTTEKGTFRCFSCGASGDVIDACEYLEKHAERWTAVVSLATRYDVEIPSRSEQWHERQKEKIDDRTWLCRAFARSYRRRLFRAFFTQYLAEVDPELREQEAKEIWEDLGPIAWAMAIRRMEK